MIGRGDIEVDYNYHPAYGDRIYDIPVVADPKLGIGTAYLVDRETGRFVVIKGIGRKSRLRALWSWLLRTSGHLYCRVRS